MASTKAHKTSKKSDQNEIVSVTSDNGQVFRFLKTPSGDMIQLQEQGSSMPNNSGVVDKPKTIKDFVNFCNQQKFSIEQYLIDGVTFVRVTKGELVKDAKEFPSFLETHALNTLKIGSSLKYQSTSLYYCTNEISNIKDWSKAHILDKYQI